MLLDWFAVDCGIAILPCGTGFVFLFAGWVLGVIVLRGSWLFKVIWMGCARMCLCCLG